MTDQTKEPITTLHIQAYDLAAFCKDVQDAFNSGYTFDFDRNEHYPTSFGAFYSATMIPVAVKLAEASAKALEAATSRAIDLSVVQGQVLKEAAVEAAEELVEKAQGKSVGRPKKV